MNWSVYTRKVHCSREGYQTDNHSPPKSSFYTRNKKEKTGMAELCESEFLPGLILSEHSVDEVHSEVIRDMVNPGFLFRRSSDNQS